VTALDEGELLRALGCVVEGLLQGGVQVQETAEKVRPLLLKLTLPSEIDKEKSISDDLSNFNPPC
jgi:hypothetical protein